MKGSLSRTHVFHITLLLLLCIHTTWFSPLSGAKFSFYVTTKVGVLPPDISPSIGSLPLLPLLAPSPLKPFTNYTLPKLSGLCSLNFSDAEHILSATAADCFNSFAKYLANVVCCPQYNAMLGTLIGQSGKLSGQLALNMTHASHCLSDIQKILASQGANEDLKNTCSVHPANLTEASCPVVAVDEFEGIVDTSRLLTACRDIDPLHESCDQVCQNAINYAAKKISLNDMSNIDGDKNLREQVARINDCKHIVLHWLASQLEPAAANGLFRGLSNCKINKVCPLVFPNITNVVEKCGNVTKNRTACCKTVKSYVSYMQNQTFITNIRALKCAASLGKKLQKASVSKNIYKLCHISLKDFSLQVTPQESGCLLPSLPSDAEIDGTSGIGFICDLNDNTAAPWPSASHVVASSCNTTTKLPSLPTATSAQNGLSVKNLVLPYLFITTLLLLSMIL